MSPLAKLEYLATMAQRYSLHAFLALLDAGQFAKLPAPRATLTATIARGVQRLHLWLARFGGWLALATLQA